MTRRILKILISLLFLAVTAVAAIFAIKNFITNSNKPKLPQHVEDNTTKYGVLVMPQRDTYGVLVMPQRDTLEGQPIYNEITKEYSVEQMHKLAPMEAYYNGTKYGIAPLKDLNEKANKK